MCGIFSVLNNKYLPIQDIKKDFLKGSKRGPEYSELLTIPKFDTTLGFHRLSINGFKQKRANQPFNINNIYLICNGEIYNHSELVNILNIVPNSRSDCEVIIHMYNKYGIEQTLQMLDGVFSFILVDTIEKKVFVARDTYGIRPLFVSIIDIYVGPEENYTSFCFASELKSLTNIGKKFNQKVSQFEPGHLSVFDYCDNQFRHSSDFCFSAPHSFSQICPENVNDVLENIYHKLYHAVEKRVKNTEREVACLLSGGLDSSIICALVKKIHTGDLHTWSIGLEGSEDLKYAQKVADHIGSIHHSIEVDESEFLEAIPEVICNIESYDTTTVRASVGNWLICKKIKEQSNAKVIFNGDGADEVMGGYLYFHKAPDCISFDKECRKLLSNIHYFDVLRSDRSISSHGLEPRTPFLDRSFVQYYLSINPTLRDHGSLNKPEKYLIRKAIHTIVPKLLPKEVLFRTKEAFSDGVSKQSKSWYEIIQDFVKTKFEHYNGIEEADIIKNYNPYVFNRPTTLEQLYYRDLFSEFFNCPTAKNVIPYFWMPNFVKATDASARTLDIYKEKI